MINLGDAKMPTLREKINSQNVEVKPVIKAAKKAGKSKK